ncbi:WD40 repeat domain-containing protein [Patescibacteria group bacterium]|nr:WD40 repeat domain-containing protein [Patescibacteria group bacterium]
MKKVLFFLIVFFFIFTLPVLAETKEYTPDAPGRMIPKLPQTPNDPELVGGHVYPMWGPVCQRYTYSVVYRDKEGRPPKYIQIYFNGKMIDLEKENQTDNDYKRGVKYIYKYVPKKIGANFYYFEASNGLGKARASIIDSPDNGPVLFESALDKNEIGLIDTQKGEKILSYPTKDEWVDQVVISNDGKYFAAKTTKNILFFETANPQKPLWEYKLELGEAGDMVGGIALSADGSVIAVATSAKVLVFDKVSNKPRWVAENMQSIGVTLSDDGQYMAAIITTPDEKNTNATTVVFWQTKDKNPLWEYYNIANFHDLDLSSDGSFLVATTGCPDRRAYIFSKDSNKPLLRSEGLTYDSPVQKTRITADGRTAAFTTDGGPDSSLLLLFDKDSKQLLWKFDDGSRRAARSLGMTPDGNFIVVGNMKGDLYLFSKENNTPLAKWQFPSSFGALDIADDGQLIAAGGTDKKVYLIDRKNNQQKEIVFNEFVDTLDVSGDGRYVAVGTGASPYFFEDILGVDRNKIYTCETIIEPKPRAQNSGIIINNGPQNGQGKPKETKAINFPGMLAGFAFLASILALGGYFLTVKFNLLRKPKENLLKINKKIVIILSALSGILLILTLVFSFMNKFISKTQQQEAPQKGGQIMTGPDQKEIKDQGVCGNTLCEPSLGEDKQNCPKDCSAQ